MNFKMLPGSEYARVALPLDYAPSRDYRARWTRDRPIRPIYDWFASHADKYKTLIAEMRACVPAMSDLDLNFYDPPKPAWLEVPYTPFDSIVLHKMTADRRPARYVEIGSGATTCLARHAVDRHGLATELVSIDPEPRIGIDAVCDRTVRAALETCDLAIFDALEPNDIVLFDGSHRSFMNSDVTVFFIDVLPRLKPGVIVHLHDIMLPWDYSEWSHNYYWNEQYMLAVYFMGNMSRIEPLAPTSFIAYDPMFADALAEPMIPLEELTDLWRHGGAMWFTHRRSS